MVAADHPLRDVGCIGGVGTWARAEDVQLGNLRGGGKRVNGIWLSEKGVIGKDKLRGFQGFLAAEDCYPDFKTLLLGGIVRYGDDGELGILARVAKCPVAAAADAKVRLMAVITPVREAYLGLLPAISMAFQTSSTSWQLVPFTKVTHVPIPASDAELLVLDLQPLPELLDLHDDIVVVDVGETQYLQLAHESPLMEQVQKTAGGDMLSDVLVRAQLQPARNKRGPSKAGGGKKEKGTASRSEIMPKNEIGCVMRVQAQR